MRRFDGSRLREVRIARHLSPEQIAVATGRSCSTVLAYERGRVTPSAASLAALADTLNVPVDDLFTTAPAAVA